MKFTSKQMLFAMLATTLATAEALAAYSGGQSAGQIAGNVSQSIANMGNLAETVAYVAAAFLGLGAVFKFKGYNDNPQQTPLKQPIGWLAAAALSAALPMVIDSGVQTMWGQGNAANYARPQGTY